MGGGTSPGPSAGQPANGPYYSSSNAGNMNNSEELHHPQRYPSPNAAQLGQGGGPFFGQPPHRLSPPDNMQLAAAQLSRSAAPMMAPSMADNQEPAAMNAASNEQTQPSNSPGAVGQDVNRELNSEEKTAPRKRSKTSRACDECRRKKIRCDAQEEKPGEPQEPCSNCKRTSAVCQFSRIPQKRGPSKGYIKELADRLNTLENTVRPSLHTDLYDEGISPRQADEFPSQTAHFSGGLPGSRKRTYSASEGVQGSNYGQPYPQRSGERLPSIGAPSGHPQYSSSASNGMSYPMWKHGPPGEGRRPSTNMPYESGDTRPFEQEQSDTGLNWNEETVDEYYRIIHQTYSLLPDSKVDLKSRLAKCPVVLREAFLDALDAAVRPSPASNVPLTSGVAFLRRAEKRLLEYEHGITAPAALSVNLVQLQTMILIVLAADHCGPASMRGQSWSSRAKSLGGAIAYAETLRLHVTPSREIYSTDGLDSDGKLARRAWWILVILDRWHACSTAVPLQIPETSVEVLPEDESVLGATTFHLARLTITLGMLATIFVIPEELRARDELNMTLVTKVLQGQMAMFRSSVGLGMDLSNLINLSSLHVNLLIKRYTPSPEPQELLGMAYNIATMLSAGPARITVLDHHFAALAALTLAELVDTPETLDGAPQHLDILSQTLRKRRSNMNHEDRDSWDFAVEDFIKTKGHSGSLTTNQGNLYQLANLAVGASGGSVNNTTGDTTAANGGPDTKTNAFDPTQLTRQGYLKVLVDNNVRS